jgi:hypothetical protein
MSHALLLLFLLTAPLAGLAQSPGHQPGMDHSAHRMHMPAGVAMPTQPGQSAFAAIEEITALLEADPATDWTKVDIEGLRQHLIDMHRVTLLAKVASARVAQGMRYTVTGGGAVKDSIRRMVRNHAASMDGAGGWRQRTSDHAEGIVLTVTVADPGDLPKLKALGFIGLLARGMHHQEHHLAMARGGNPHH